MGHALAIGLDFLFAIVAGGVLGWLIDRWADSSPIAILVGISLGFGAGTYRMLKRLNAQDKASKPKQPPNGPSER